MEPDLAGAPKKESFISCGATAGIEYMVRDLLTCAFAGVHDSEVKLGFMMTVRKRLVSALIAAFESGDRMLFLSCFRRLVKELDHVASTRCCTAIDLAIGGAVLRRRIPSAATVHVRDDFVWGGVWLTAVSDCMGHCHNCGQARIVCG